MAQGPKCSLCSDLATLEFSIKARWKFTSLLVLLLFWLVWVFFLWRSWKRDSRGEKEEDNSSPAPVDTDICGFWRWRMCPCVFWRLYFLKPLLFYEVHGTEAFLGCSNLTWALGIARGVCWLWCCISLLSGLSWEYFWWAINHLQMYFQTQFSILFADHKWETNCPNASAPWLCRMEICNFSWGINNNPRCWQAIKVRKFSWFNNLEVIKFAYKWLEAPVSFCASVCAPDHGGSGLGLGRQRGLGGSNSSGLSRTRATKALSDVLCWVWAPPNWW